MRFVGSIKVYGIHTDDWKILKLEWIRNLVHQDEKASKCLKFINDY